MNILPGLPEALQAIQELQPNTVQTEEQLNQLVEKLNTADIIALDTETTGLHMPTLGLVGISFAFGRYRDRDTWYIPVGHTALDKQLPLRKVLSAIKPGLEREKKKVILHHAKFDLGVMQKFGIDIPQKVSLKEESTIEDTMIMSYIIDENERKSLKKLAQKFLGMEMKTFNSLFGSGKSSKGFYDDNEDTDFESEVLGIIDDDDSDDDYNIANVAVQVAAEYAKDDALATLGLYEYFIERLHEEGLYKPYFYEMKVVPVMVHMHSHGVMIDVEKANQKFQDAVKEIEDIEDRIKNLLLEVPKIRKRVEERRYTVAGIRKKDRDNVELKKLLNLGSNKLKQQILYEDLGLADEQTIKTKSGRFATGKWALQALVRKGKKEDATKNEKIGGEVAEGLLTHVKKKKLVDAFFRPLATKIINGRVYGHFNNIGTKTGRMTSYDPNLQQMPRDTKTYTFRDIFIVPEGYKWVSVDLSQIELRMAAHFSQDKNMMDVYIRGEDIHTKTTKLIFGIGPEDFELGDEDKEFKTKRTISKTFNFAMLYGAAGPKLRNMLINDSGVSEDIATLEFCEETAKGWFAGYPGIQEYIKQQNMIATEQKWVETILKRKRRLPDAIPPGRFPGKKHPDYEAWRIRNSKYGSAMRISVNTVIQGSSADLMKIMMVMVYDSIKSGKWDVGDKKCKLLTQVHDELNFEVPEEVAEEFKEFVESTMKKVGEIMKIRVPIIGEGGISKGNELNGGSWSEAK